MEALINRPPCKVCRYFAQKKNEKPDCDNCLPDLYPENIEATECYPFVYDQIRSNGSLDLSALFRIMDLFEVKDMQTCIKKIKFLFYEMNKKHGSNP